MRKSPSSWQCYRFWPWAIAGRGEYPRRTGRNEHGLRDPTGNYGLSCSINTSKKTPARPAPFLHLTHPVFNPVSPTTPSLNASVARGDTIRRGGGKQGTANEHRRAKRWCRPKGTRIGKHGLLDSRSAMPCRLTRDLISVVSRTELTARGSFVP